MPPAPPRCAFPTWIWRAGRVPFDGGQIPGQMHLPRCWLEQPAESHRAPTEQGYRQLAIKKKKVLSGFLFSLFSLLFFLEILDIYFWREKRSGLSCENFGFSRSNFDFVIEKLQLFCI